MGVADRSVGVASNKNLVILGAIWLDNCSKTSRIWFSKISTEFLTRMLIVFLHASETKPPWMSSNLVKMSSTPSSWNKKKNYSFLDFCRNVYGAKLQTFKRHDIFQFIKRILQSCAWNFSIHFDWKEKQWSKTSYFSPLYKKPSILLLTWGKGLIACKTNSRLLTTWHCSLLNPTSISSLSTPVAPIAHLETNFLA